MKKFKVFISVVATLLVSGGVAWATNFISTINSDSTLNQLLQGSGNISVSDNGTGTHTINWYGSLPVSKGGTGLKSLTSGHILFGNTSASMSSNTNLLWNNVSNRLRIGGTVEATQQVTTNTIVASGSNQSISLTPSGEGTVNIGGKSLVVAKFISESSIASASTGQIYFDRTSKKFKGYNGTSWVSFRDTASVSALAKVLVVAGGGGGGSSAGGGGGGGGVVYDSSHTIRDQAYSVVIGAGGAGGDYSAGLNHNGSNGEDSFFDDMTAIGGGGGASSETGPGNDGGSGGGGGKGNGGDHSGGAATQGSSGGETGYGSNGGTADGTVNDGAGGGGAGAAGSPNSGATGGAGGIGIDDATVGNLLSTASAPDTDHIAGGGGGYGTGTAGSGGNGGGGQSASYPTTSNPGVENTGGGGGNGWNSVGGVQADSNGGSGIVIIVYTTNDFDRFTYTGGSYATGTSGSETWIKLTSRGTLTFIGK